jgi:hypothetical protein
LFVISRVRAWWQARKAFLSAVREIENAGYHISPATWSRLKAEAKLATGSEPQGQPVQPRFGGDSGGTGPQQTTRWRPSREQLPVVRDS